MASTPDKNWRTVRFDVLERIDRMPSLSSVIHEFLALSMRDMFSAGDFEKVIAKDQALVARLLRVANSGLYGRSRSISSIAEAVVLVGLENLKRIVFAVTTEGLTRRKLVHYDYHDQGGFWLHAMGVALAARTFAEAVPKGKFRPEEAFVGGLLHDVGKLVIDEFLEEDAGGKVTKQQEVSAIGLDHAELAEYILNQWNLPEPVTRAVRHHHSDLDDPANFEGGLILGLAEKVCDVWGFGRRLAVDLSADVPLDPFADVLAHLGIGAGRWDQLVWDIRQHLSGCEELYRLDS